MPKAKYDIIYHDLKQKIEDEMYAYQDLLPSEHLLVQTYDCSRNTVRRALAELTAEGYVQPMHGKGVRNIFQPVDQAAFTVGGIESFLESAIRNKKVPFTKVLHFSQLSADETISKDRFPFRHQIVLHSTSALLGWNSAHSGSQLFQHGAGKRSDPGNRPQFRL